MPPRESLKYEVKLTSVWKLRVFNTHFYLVEWYAQLLCVIPFQGSLIGKIKSGFLDNQLRVTAVVRSSCFMSRTVRYAQVLFVIPFQGIV